MANNLVVQLLLKTGTFSTDLKQARGQVQNFQKGCQTAGKSLSGFGQALGLNVGGLAKFGGAVGAAVLAGKEFKAVIDSSQTTSDAFQGAIAGCKGVIDSFNTALATADFTSFKDGLWGIYDAAKEVQKALDELGNTQIAYDFMSKENTTKFQQAYTVFKDPKATDQMKKDAQDQMKEAVDAQYTYASNYSSKLYNAYVTQVVKKAGKSNLQGFRVTREQFRKAMKIDLGVYGDSEDQRNSINRQYNEYTKKLKEYGKNNIVAQDNLKKQYADVISIHAMLELMKDDELKGVAGLIGGMEEAEQVAISMEKTMNRALGSSGSGSKETGTSKKLKDEIPVMEESLSYWEKLAAEMKKHRDAEVFNSDEWNTYNDALTEALDKITDINKQTEVMAKRKEMEANPLTPIDSTALQGKAVMTTQYDIFGKVIPDQKTQAELQNLINLFEKLKSELKEGDPLIAQYNIQIEELRKRLEKFKTAGVEQPVVKKETISTWDAFNQSMSNTATIVSSLTDTFRESSEVTAASVLQMVATCLPAIGSLIGAIGALTTAEAVEAGVNAVGKAVSTSRHWIEAIAAVASLAAVVAGAIAAARKPLQDSHYATGGIVPGTSFTGDRVSAQVNSGEMILTKTQQARLFRMANGQEGTGAGQVTFHISGTDLVGVLNNNMRKQKIIG